MILFRYFLIGLIIYLFFRSVVRFFEGESSESQKSTNNRQNKKDKGVPKDLGEFIDYEEVDD